MHKAAAMLSSSEKTSTGLIQINWQVYKIIKFKSNQLTSLSKGSASLMKALWENPFSGVIERDSNENSWVTSIPLGVPTDADISSVIPVKELEPPRIPFIFVSAI